MTSLQLARKARELTLSNRPARLYKSIIRCVIINRFIGRLRRVFVGGCQFHFQEFVLTILFPFLDDDSEIPRVLVIFDIVNMGETEIRSKVRQHFYKHAHIKDDRIISMLLEQGYIDLEDTLLQHKQKPHLMLLLEGRVGTDFNSKALSADATEEEHMQRWLH